LPIYRLTDTACPLRVEATNAFKRDYKRESKGKYKAALESDFAKVVQALAKDEQLE